MPFGCFAWLILPGYSSRTRFNGRSRLRGSLAGAPRITPAIAPHAPYTVADDHLIEAQAFAVDRASPLIIHLSETNHEVQESLRLKGARPVEHLARLALLSDRMVAAHVVWAEAHELDLFRDPTMVSALEAFEMATIRGARALHLDAQIGLLEVGKRADLVVLEMEAINQIPLSSIYSALVYTSKASDVCDVLVEGQVLLRQRQLKTLNDAAIEAEALLFSRQIIERLGLVP
jgi:cytosine/adenosine deaminase-related metal-dependent hydrolase